MTKLIIYPLAAFGAYTAVADRHRCEQLEHEWKVGR